ncbi:tetratricopeptide repeat protein [Fulvivirga sp. 29W222]|uniref:Tetratricopeptide repeat protein n=1 Tax=Fulvivirga marina TaxID=2494733 RepID=A0A937FYG4_9BACT|nr:tetratricopeptide repeat protein [Fulvivirga marina]MBL6446685.1 tetratricopeptide repeat protein [Fulvivirga marina]
MNSLIKLHPNSICSTLSNLLEFKYLLSKIISTKFILAILVCCFLGHTVVSQKYVRELDSLNLVLKKLSKKDTSRVNALIEMANIQTYTATGDVFKYTDEATEISREIGYTTGLIEIDFLLAYYYDHSGNSPKALNYLYDALEKSKENNDLARMAKCYNFLGLVHESLDQDKEALEYYKESLSLWESEQNPYMVGLLLENIGYIYAEQGNNELALEYYSKAFSIAEEENIEIRLGSVYNAMGKIYFKEGELDKALEAQKYALEYASKKESIILLSRAHCAISAIYMKKKHPEEALASAEKALHFARLSGSKHDISDGYKRLNEAFHALGDYEKAYEYQSKYMTLHDSLKNLENVKAMERLKHKLNMELIDQRHKTNLLKRNAMIGVLVSLLIIGFLIFNRRYLLMKKRLDSKRQLLNYSIRNLKEKTELVEKVNKELKIFKENATHDVKIQKFNKVLQFNIVTDDDWENFKKAFEDVYPNFIASLRYHYPNLTTAEIRQATLIKMKLTIKETASVLGITPESVKKSRHRLKKKLDLKENETVEEILDSVHAKISHG